MHTDGTQLHIRNCLTILKPRMSYKYVMITHKHTLAIHADPELSPTIAKVIFNKSAGDNRVSQSNMLCSIWWLRRVSWRKDSQIFLFPPPPRKNPRGLVLHAI
jgi:hypothetical protein